MPTMDINVTGTAGRNAPVSAPVVHQEGSQSAAPDDLQQAGFSGTKKGQMSEICKGEQVAQEVAEKRNHSVAKMDVAPMELDRRNLHLAVFQPTGDLYAKVVKSDTGEIVKTIPPEALLRTWARMDAYVGRLIDDEA